MSRPERGEGRVKDPELHKADVEKWTAEIAKDPWSGWRALLKDDATPLVLQKPLQGYYRNKRKDGTYIAVAFWYEGGQLFCHVQHRGVIPETEALETWQWCSHRPISHQVYKQVTEQGLPWPDLDERLADQLQDNRDAKREAAKGDNRPPAEDSREAIAAQIDNILPAVDNYKRIETPEELAQSQSVRSRLLELKNLSDKQRKKLGDPHYAEYKKINAEWNPLVDRSGAGAELIRRAQEDYQTRQRNAARKAEEDARRAAEEAAKKAPPLASNEPPPEATQPAPVTPQPAMPTPIRGGYGRAASTKFVDTVTEITDPIELFKFIIGAEDPAGSKKYPKMHPEMHTFLLTLAQRAVNAKLVPPGVKIEEKAKVT